METRVQKYKTYRASFVKQGATTYKQVDTTSTQAIPLDQVMDQVEHKEITDDYYAKQRKLQKIKVILIALLVICVVVGLVLFGIYAFRSN